jgi:hypothetical protein
MQQTTLLAIKLAHTVVWAIFASSIVALPFFAWRREFKVAAALIALVLIEVLVLVVNRMRCPLTDVAEKYTADRQPNFDIFLPLWLARYNKQIFGVLFVAGMLYTIVRWSRP